MSRTSEHVIDFKLTLDSRLLVALNLYRLLMPLILLGLHSPGGAKGFLQSRDRFFWTNVFYLCFGLASVILVKRRFAAAFRVILPAELVQQHSKTKLPYRAHPI